MFHYVYRIDNLLNGRFYIGVHSSKKDPTKDNYFGSGKCIREAIKKHGKQNFKKTILHLCSDRPTAENLERDLVDLENPKTYNLIPGGGGGAFLGKVRKQKLHKPMPEDTKRKIGEAQLGVKKPKHSEEANKKKSERMKGKPNLFLRSDEGKAFIAKNAEKAKAAYASGDRIHHYLGKHRSAEEKAKISASLKGNIPYNKGKPASEETRRKMSEAKRGNHDKLSARLLTMNMSYEHFKNQVIKLHAVGLGPTKILHALSLQCIMTESPIKSIIKDLQ